MNISIPDKAAVKRHLLPRTGAPGLHFEGARLLQADNRFQKGKSQQRWYEVSIFGVGKNGSRPLGAERTIVLWVAYRTQWRGEMNHDTVVICQTLAEVGETLRQFNPLLAVKGFPPLEKYAERQARLQAWIKESFDALVAKIVATRLEFDPPEEL